MEELLDNSNCFKVFFLYSNNKSMEAGRVRVSPRPNTPEEDPSSDVHDEEDKLSCNLAYSAYTLDKLIHDRQANFYVCGPPSFNSQSIEFLLGLDIPVDNIFCETYGPMRI